MMLIRSGGVLTAAGVFLSFFALNGPAHAGAHATQVPSSAGLSSALATHYKAMAAEETFEKDAADEAHFSAKAAAAAAGQPVGPDLPDSRNLGADDASYAAASHARIMAAYDKGAADTLPQQLADAQTGYDCWMQEQEEGYQLLHISACRSRMETALAAIEKPMVDPKPAAPSKPQPPQQRDYVIYFAFDSAALDARALQEIDRIAAAVAAYPDPQLDVIGHTDTSGSSDYNRALSKRRADAVANALNARGLSSRVIDEGFMGENLPAVQTGDGVREPLNRRVTVSLANDG